MPSLVLVLLLLAFALPSHENNSVNSILSLIKHETTVHKSHVNSSFPGKWDLEQTCFYSCLNQRKFLLKCGDISPQPGPTIDTRSQSNTLATASDTRKRTPKFPCRVCCKGVTAASKAVSCDGCSVWTHQRCTGGEVSLETYQRLSTNGDQLSFRCSSCLLDILPFSGDFDDADDDVFYSLPATGGNAAFHPVLPTGDPAQAARSSTSGTGVAPTTAPTAPSMAIQDTHLDALRGKGLLFIHANVRSLLPKLPEIKLFLNRTKAAILAISETWLDNTVTDAELNVDGYSVLRKDRNRHGGGVCMFINNHLNYDKRNINVPDIECLAVDLLLPHTKPISFAVCYRPPTDYSFITKLGTILNDFDSHNEVYLMGDFNICVKQKGTLSKSYLGLLNDFSYRQLIDQPTRVTNDSSSIIDHVISNANGKMGKSGVLDIGLSDHQFTYFTRGQIKNPCFNHVIHRFRSLKNYCKEAFCYRLKHIDWSPVLIETDVELSLKTFVDMLLQVINEIAPYNQVRVKHNTAPWMCREILLSIRKRDILFRKFKQDRGNRGAYAAYCKQRNLVQRGIKIAKSGYFRQKVSECGGDSGKLWRQLGSLGYSEAKEKSSIVLEQNGTKFFDSSRVAAIFNNFYTKVAHELVSLLPSPSGLFTTTSTTFKDFYRKKGIFGPSFTLTPVSKHFVLKQILSFNPRKGAGLDDISPRFLHDGAEHLACPIQHIINLSILTETVPSGLKQAKVVPIFKKGSRLDPGNYRPVSILSSISKILERAVNTQLVEYFNKKGLFFEFQSGFRAGHSTETCLINLTDHIKGEISKGNMVGMVFIDLRKAFDTVDSDILVDKLSAMGITSLDWFRSYLSGREQCTQVDGTNSSFLQVTCGVPQGSILGPTLFLAYINDMSSCLNCRLSLYADDSALIFSGKNAGNLATFLSRELSSCKKWLVDNRLSLHVGKTESILFGTRRSISRAGDFKVTCDGEMVQRVTSVKYLGVILDQFLQFDEFVAKTCDKANGKLRFLYRYSSLLDFNTRRLLCNSLIYSNLTYCVSAWYPGLGTALQQRLDTIQRKVVRYANGWRPRSHVGAQEISAVGWLCFPKRVQFSKLCQLFKVRMGVAPDYLSADFIHLRDTHSHSTRGSDLNYFADSRKFPPGTFHYSVVREWNDLPDTIKKARNLVGFKRELRKHLSL